MANKDVVFTGDVKIVPLTGEQPITPPEVLRILTGGYQDEIVSYSSLSKGRKGMVVHYTEEVLKPTEVVKMGNGHVLGPHWKLESLFRYTGKANLPSGVICKRYLCVESHHMSGDIPKGAEWLPILSDDGTLELVRGHIPKGVCINAVTKDGQRKSFIG